MLGTPRTPEDSWLGHFLLPKGSDGQTQAKAKPGSLGLGGRSTRSLARRSTSS